jgi:hypothetical protein
MKELKDFIHLYLGCECKTPDGILVLNGLNITDSRYQVWFYCRWDDKKNCYLPKRNAEILGKQSMVGKAFKYSEIKPILRPLSDVSDKEWDEIEEKIDLFFDAQGMGVIKDNFLSDKNDERCGWPLINDALIELRKRSVDVDGLIESGLAIDSKTLKEKI